MLKLDTDITKISRVGEVTAKRLKKLGLETVQDLLFYWPWRYDDFSKLTPIDKLEEGARANVVGQIELIQNKRSYKKRLNITEALISDETETIKVVWFNQPFIAKNLKVGDTVSLAGKVEDDYTGFMMNSPTYEKIYPSPVSLRSTTPPRIRGGAGGEVSGLHTQGIVPNYHLTANITQKQLRFLIKQVINLSQEITDWLPAEILKNLKLLNLGDAISKIHFPKTEPDIRQAKNRLAFNELFLIQMQSQLIQKDLQKLQAPKIEFKKSATKKFVDSLPFKLTNAQKKSAWEILQDLETSKPMTRLLEGDVGSGKTLVAVLAMLNVALNNKQAVLMVPTEILAQQHYDTLCKLLACLNIKIGLVTSSVKKMNHELGIRNKGIIDNKSKKKTPNSSFIIHNSHIIIGTHALIQQNIEFNNLTLAIIDEQHRFGVNQRRALMQESAQVRTSPHLLSMTATPIPRSLALALYGDLDISIINEMPQGRKKIMTSVVPEFKRTKAYGFIREQIEKDRQVFVICPLIDISDKLGVKSVKVEYKKLNEHIFPDLDIGILHGQLKPKDKDQVMKDFLNNKIKILVSTSVVEVGVDVPNATIMMIEGADRFGLAQLHQFRGRVGRSDHQSYCFLFTDSDQEKTLKRLQALVNNNDGFELAKMDLRFRGPGEVYGTAQKGFPELKIASLFDYELMKLAQSEAKKIIKNDPKLADLPLLREKLRELTKNTHLE